MRKCKICQKKLKSNGKTGFCLSCATKERLKDPTKNPMFGKKHKDRAVFRKNTYSNVNYNDRIEEFSLKGHSRKKYRMTCIQCGQDRGYQRNIDALRICVQCRNKNVTCHTKEQKHLRSCMRANLNARLKQRLLSKNKKSTFDVLPYTIDKLIDHLESQFQPGMTWENHGQGPGTWQIDHITPDSWFVYNSMDDQGFKDSWDLNNLQPLWWRDNCSKGNRFQG